MTERTVDALGRKNPTRVGWELLLEAIPGLARQFRPVPSSYFTGDSHIAHVKCVCGAKTMVPVNSTSSCKCGRIFLYTPFELWAAKPLKDDGSAADPPAGFPSTRS